MKKITKPAALLTLLLSFCLVLSLAGCSSFTSGDVSTENVTMQMDSGSSPMAAPAPAPAAPPRARMAGDGNSMGMNAVNMKSEAPASDMVAEVTAPVSDRKLVKNAQMVLETKAFDTAIPDLIKMVESVGGYVENQSVDGRSMRAEGEYYERNANIVARVPADKLATVTSQMGTLCNVSSQSESIDDITDRYFDAAVHLDMLKVQETRLLELLEKAETLENIIQLEEALTNCQYEIESLSGQIRRMDSQVSYSTLRLSINEVVDYSISKEKPKNFVERLGDAFLRSGKNIARAAEGILFFLIIDGPVLAINLLFLGIVVYILYRIVRRHHSKSQSKRLSQKGLPTPEAKPESRPEPEENQ